MYICADIIMYTYILAVQSNFPAYLVKDLQKVVEQDPFAQLEDQDMELIWKMRYVKLIF